jgi:ABC-type Mn2+/Zn2+ transport system ATPase subunit
MTQNAIFAARLASEDLCRQRSRPLKGIDLDIPRGSNVRAAGFNGAGKSS